MLQWFISIAGFGLRCHRVLRTIAQLIGIKDLHCNVDGNTKNYKAIAQAFFNGLLEQVTSFNPFVAYSTRCT
jgi:ribosomal protein S5